jgi:hypothetical protein
MRFLPYIAAAFWSLAYSVFRGVGLILKAPWTAIVEAAGFLAGDRPASPKRVLDNTDLQAEIALQWNQVHGSRSAMDGGSIYMGLIAISVPRRRVGRNRRQL